MAPVGPRDRTQVSVAAMLGLPETGDRPLRVLALGAHADDIEIGCGGTLLTLARSRVVEVTWVVLGGAEPERAVEARRSADASLLDAATADVVVADFRDAYMPTVGAPIKEFVQRLADSHQPDLVFTHQRNDLHQDHRLVCELTWNAFRDHLILEYEIPKWDGDMGAPSVFAPLSDAVAREKVDLLMTHFGSQRSKDWFSSELFVSLMRLRAMECRALGGAAEAFYARKLTLNLS